MDRQKRLKQILSVSLSVFFIFFVSILIINFVRNTPTEYNISIGDEYSLHTRFPLSFSIDAQDKSIIELVKSKEDKSLFSSKDVLQLKTLEKGSTDLQLKILGFVPYRTVRVNIVPKIEVIPGGQSIGVKLNTDGVLIVGFADLVDDTGVKHNIGAETGIKIGDSLIEINGQKINNASHVGEIIKKSNGKELELKIKRDKKVFSVKVSPIKSEQDGEYRFGLWVRDKTAGVGTLSFVHPQSKKFGALGHAITDVDTGSLLSVKNGEVVKSKVVAIEQGRKGKPGEIRGIFYETNNPIGKLEKNTQFGVYGEVFNYVDHYTKISPIPIAYQHEITEGPAHILTTLDNNTITKYDIEIVKVNFQSKPEPKSMIIKVTDKNLLEKTGGIVQGMSGSPIIQNGKVVGAVTHVLINDPTKGYGIFIEWMLNESGIYDKNP